jgi:hypothetical protein
VKSTPAGNNHAVSGIYCNAKTWSVGPIAVWSEATSFGGDFSRLSAESMASCSARAIWFSLNCTTCQRREFSRRSVEFQGPVMIHELCTSKRVVAACGVVLMLLSLLQHAHAFCSVAGCRQNQGNGKSPCCCLGSSRSDDSSFATRGGEGGSCRALPTPSTEAPGCPSPGNCICCQTTPPANTLSATVADTVTTMADAMICGGFATDLRFTQRLSICGAPECNSVTYSLVTCARLCRFLV